MIKIVNVATKGKAHIYNVYINDDLITTFNHERRNGLGSCLMEASKAVDIKKWEEIGKCMNLRKIGEQVDGNK